jgi:hypothetical protein
MIVYGDFNKGRLGNQLFFVASTIGIAIKNNTECGFYSNMGFGGNDYQFIFEKSLPITNYVPSKKYNQEDFSYYDISVDDVELNGYFQSEKFFLHCKDLILNQFEFKTEIVNSILSKYEESKSSLGVHVRRGDYVNQPNHHPTLSMEYYNSIIENKSNEYDKIFIFSDDVDWVKNNFSGDKFIFPHFEENNDLFSFILLSLMKDIVISNSTYSWWAAWLNKNKDKKIYSPNHSKWFGPMYDNLNTKDIIPENWIQINL